MYETNEVPVARRVIILVLTAIAIIAIVWLTVWLIFFRHPEPAKVTKQKPTATSSQSSQPTKPSSSTSSGSNQSGSSATPASGSNPTSPSANQNTSSASTTTPALANTGPGNVIPPVLAASVLGAGAYHTYLRRKYADR